MRATSIAPRTFPIFPRLTVLGAERPGVLHAAEVDRDERRPVELERHLGELLLRELVGGDRLPEDDRSFA